MNRYSDYKDSDIDWAGNIPIHWTVTQPKYLLNRVTREPDDTDDVVTCFRDGTVTLRKNRREDGFTNSLKEIGYQQILPGDLVVHEMDGFAGAIGISDSKGKSTPVYTVIEPDDRTDLKYVVYLLREMSRSGKIESLARSIRERTTDFRWGMWSVINFCFPPINEQKEIVKYLDGKLSQIDSLIEKTQRKIELLKEQQTATINHYVTKGLDPTVKMKDSGIEWIGEIPEHWSIKRIKNLGSIRSGDGITNSDLVDDGIYPVYGGNGIIGSFTHSNVRETVIVIGRVGEKCGNVHLVDEESWISDNALILEIYQKNTLPWLHLSLMTRDLNKLRNQSSQPLITGTQVKNESIPYPPIDEMIKLCHKINQKSLPLLKTIDVEFKRIELLKEYRQTLISNVVTGKVRVTEEVI